MIPSGILGCPLGPGDLLFKARVHTIPASMAGASSSRAMSRRRAPVFRISVAILGISSKFPAPMSQHPSLKGKGTIQAKRSVLKRFERVELMKKRGQYKPGQRVIGLPKTKPED